MNLDGWSHGLWVRVWHPTDDTPSFLAFLGAQGLVDHEIFTTDIARFGIGGSWTGESSESGALNLGMPHLMGSLSWELGVWRCDTHGQLY